jgi:hypothetical protein
MASQGRYCINALDGSGNNTCPPNYGSTTVHWDNPANGVSSHYNTFDYAMDMTDSVALTKSTNIHEALGNDIAIYTIGLSASLGNNAMAENLLRYMASVGDDGDRTTNPCLTAPANTNCGQYYFAPSGDQLLPIFEDIATRIYTRITD